MKRVAALEAEIERLEFLNKEEQATIDALSKLITELADVLEDGASIEDFDCTKRLKLIQRAREAVE